MRWLIAVVVALAVVAPAEAGVFKQRGGSKPAAAPAPAKKPAAAPAKKAAAPAKKTQVSKAPAKKSAPAEESPVAAAPTKKKGKGGDVTITVEDEDDVIIRDIDD